VRVAPIAGPEPPVRAAAVPAMPPPRLLAPVGLPAELLAAAHAMEATRASSERFSVRIAVASAGAHVPRGLQRF
jgi:hypothetical protein